MSLKQDGVSGVKSLPIMILLLATPTSVVMSRHCVLILVYHNTVVRLGEI